MLTRYKEYSTQFVITSSNVIKELQKVINNFLKKPSNFIKWTDIIKIYYVTDTDNCFKIERENLIKNLLEKLWEEQIQSVIVEGGSFTLQQFIDAGIWDEAFVIKANNLSLTNGTKAPVFSPKPNKISNLRNNTLYHFQNQ